MIWLLALMIPSALFCAWIGWVALFAWIGAARE